MGDFKPHASYLVNSKDRTMGSIENFCIELHQLTYNQDPDKQYFVRLEDIEFPLSFYNINDSNNTLRVQEDDGAASYDAALVITVSNGNYTISELITELETQLDAGTGRSNAYTISYNSISNKILFSFTGATSNNVRIDSVANGSTLNEILGFTAYNDTTSQVVIADGNTTENTYSVDLDIESYINIYSNLHIDNSYVKDEKRNLLCRVPMSVDRFTKQFFANHEGQLMRLSSKQPVKCVEFLLESETGASANTNPAFSMNDTNYSFRMVIYEYNKPSHMSSHSWNK